MPIVTQQQTDPRFLLTKPSGWDFAVAPRIVHQIPADQLPHVIVEGFEWNDVELGFGSVQQQAAAAVARLREAIQARGSDVYAYALLHHTDSNVCLPVIGCVERSDRYRLVIAHSQIQIGFWGIIAIGTLFFAALVVYQYLTTGKSPALADLQAFWGSGVAAVGSAVGEAGGGLATPFVWLTIAGGVTALAFALAGKSAGVKTPAPRPVGGSIGVKAGPVSGRVGN